MLTSLLKALPSTAGGMGQATDAAAPAARIDWVRTLVAKGCQRLGAQHLRHWHDPVRQPVLHLIALDTSGSMRRGGALEQAKGLAAALITQAKRQGDDVALLGFGGQGVQLLLSPQTARLAAVAHIRPLGGGGGTPLADCMQQAQRLLLTRQRQQQGAQSALWLLTDGRSLQVPQRPRLATQAVIVDFDDPLHPVGRCAHWAQTWRAVCWQPGQGPLPKAVFFGAHPQHTP